MTEHQLVTVTFTDGTVAHVRPETAERLGRGVEQKKAGTRRGRPKASPDPEGE